MHGLHNVNTSFDFSVHNIQGFLAQGTGDSFLCHVIKMLSKQSRLSMSRVIKFHLICSCFLHLSLKHVCLQYCDLQLHGMISEHMVFCYQLQKMKWLFIVLQTTLLLLTNIRGMVNGKLLSFTLLVSFSCFNFCFIIHLLFLLFLVLMT